MIRSSVMWDGKRRAESQGTKEGVMDKGEGKWLRRCLHDREKPTKIQYKNVLPCKEPSPPLSNLWSCHVLVQKKLMALIFDGSVLLSLVASCRLIFALAWIWQIMLVADHLEEHSKR